MDTESFLLRRQQLETTMEARRALISGYATGEASPGGHASSLSWWDILLGLRSEGGLSRGLQKIFFAAIVPLVFTGFKNWPLASLFRSSSLPEWLFRNSLGRLFSRK